jgi:hypothetical protein
VAPSSPNREIANAQVLVVWSNMVVFPSDSLASIRVDSWHSWFGKSAALECTVNRR